jgi:hypothetical protein
MTRPFGKLPNLNDHVKGSTFWKSLFVCLCFTCSYCFWSFCCVKDGEIKCIDVEAMICNQQRNFFPFFIILLDV